MSINDYYKIHAYACFYKAFNNLGLDECFCNIEKYFAGEARDKCVKR